MKGRKFYWIAWGGFTLTMAIPPAVSSDQKGEPDSRDQPPAQQLRVIEPTVLRHLQELRPRLLASAREPMVNYSAKVPQTDFSYDMIALPGGEFLMGSPANEAGRRPDEGPQIRVRLQPFWMGKHEVTWDLYQLFLDTVWASLSRREASGSGNVQHSPVDEIFQATFPSEIVPNVDLSFGMGKEGFPAVNMTRHAASRFCLWLTFHTGRWYRLPTEAEWEYACRAGTTTAYHFGDDPETLGNFEVFDPIGNRTGYSKVGTGKPNPWGLYDMHGNVMEWCLDQYHADIYAKWISSGAPVESPFAPPSRLHPGSVRGGSWYDEASHCRSAVRSFSHPDWQSGTGISGESKSRWWLTEARWLGFRIVRPRQIPSAEEIYRLWSFDEFEKEGREKR
jgi:formylglycine-generating enzyme required for sulfatase activity